MRSHTPTKLSRNPEPRRNVSLCSSGDAMKRLPQCKTYGQEFVLDTAHHVSMLERASEGLIPRLGGGDAAHDVLAVAYIEIEVGEELLLGQGVGRVDAEVGRGPGRAHTRRTAHFDAPPDAQAIGQARLERGGHVEIALALELRPEGVPQGGAGHLPGTGPRGGIVGTGKVGT